MLIPHIKFINFLKFFSMADCREAIFLTTPPNGKISMSVEDLYCHTERAVYEVKQYQSCQELHRSQGATGVRQRSVSENGVKASAKEMFMEVEVTEKKSILDKIKNTILFKIFR